MRKAVLVDFSNVYSFSARSISSYLKSRGFGAATIHYNSGNVGDLFSPLSDKSLELLYDYCKDCDVVGISVLSTHYLNRAIQINNFLKSRIKAPIIWGGVPVICDPYFYLQYADIICAGEGEAVMTDLLTGRDVKDIPGCSYKRENGEAVINNIPPLLDLNEMPIPYFDFENTFVLRRERMTSLKEDLGPLYLQSGKGYRIFPIRGCPYSCTFCSNNRLKSVFKASGPFLRSVKPERIIAELKKAKEIIPDLNKIMFYEDDFMVRKEDELKELLNMYSKEIALPFNINATIQSISEEKIDLVSNTGTKLEFIKVGLQAANKRVNKEVFKRYFDRDTYLQKLEMLTSKGIPIVLDVISDNPYENVNDKYESLLFYKELSRRLKRASLIDNPVTIMDHKLMYYPGTFLYNEALEEKIINDNYIDDILLSRRTTRNKNKDMDNDAFILALFRMASKKRNLGLPNGFFKILENKNIFLVLCKLNILGFLAFLIKRTRDALRKTPGFIKSAKQNRR